MSGPKEKIEIINSLKQLILIERERFIILSKHENVIEELKKLQARINGLEKKLVEWKNK